jgi:pimeloyl-ACP methyl ester carboxylesterase
MRGYYIIAPGTDRCIMVEDLETVVDSAGLERFVLLGLSQSGAVAIAYASRHPERLTHLIIYGAFARGLLHRENPEKQKQTLELTRTAPSSITGGSITFNVLPPRPKWQNGYQPRPRSPSLRREHRSKEGNVAANYLFERSYRFPGIQPNSGDRMERVVDVPPHLVWEAWTQPEHLKKWFCPLPWKTIDCDLHGAPARSAIADVEELPSQSNGGDCVVFPTRERAGPKSF